MKSFTNWFRTNPRLSITLIILLLLGLFFLQIYIDKQPEKENIIQTSTFETIPSVEYLGAYTGSIVLGGFKPLIVDYLWIKADKLKQRRQYEEIVSLLKLIAQLQPTFVDVWIYNSSVMAYDISRSQDSLEKQWEWVQAGVDYLKKGLDYNPDDIDIMERMGLIYFHRIPQDRYLMNKLEETTGKDCYTIAAEWYQKMAEVLKKKDASPYKVETWETMTAGTRFHHIFELVGKRQFDEAIKAIDELVAFGNNVVKTYNVELHLWEKRIRSYQALKPVLLLEKELGQYNPEINPNEFFAQLLKVLNRYKEIIETHSIINNVPIRARIEDLFLVYFGQIYQAVQQNQFDEAKMWWQKMMQLNQQLTPADSTHISVFFFNRLTDRLNNLGMTLQLEERLSKAVKTKDIPSFNSLLEETIESYEEYISVYRELFRMPFETNRLKELQGIWRKQE